MENIQLNQAKIEEIIKTKLLQSLNNIVGFSKECNLMAVNLAAIPVLISLSNFSVVIVSLSLNAAVLLDFILLSPIQMDLCHTVSYNVKPAILAGSVSIKPSFLQRACG